MLRDDLHLELKKGYSEHARDNINSISVCRLILETAEYVALSHYFEKSHSEPRHNTLDQGYETSFAAKSDSLLQRHPV